MHSPLASSTVKSRMRHAQPSKLKSEAKRGTRSPLRRVSVPFPSCGSPSQSEGTLVESLIRQYYVKDKVQWYEKLFGESSECLEAEKVKNTTLKELLKHKEDRIEMLEQENAKLARVTSSAAQVSKKLEEMESSAQYREQIVQEMEEVKEQRVRKIEYLEEKATSARRKHRKSVEAADGREVQQKLELRVREIERELSQERSAKDDCVVQIEEEQKKQAMQQERMALLEQRLDEMAGILTATIEEKQSLQAKLQAADNRTALPREPSVQVDSSLVDGDFEGILSMVASGLTAGDLDFDDADYEMSESEVWFSDMETEGSEMDDIVDDDVGVEAQADTSLAQLPRSGSRFVTAQLMGEIANQSSAALNTLEDTIMGTIQEKNSQILQTKMQLLAFRDRLHAALEEQARNESQVQTLNRELHKYEEQVDSLEAQVEEHKEQERLLMKKETERLRSEIAALQMETAERTFDILSLRKGIRRSISTLSKDLQEQVAMEYLDSLVDVRSFVDVCLADELPDVSAIEAGLHRGGMTASAAAVEAVLDAPAVQHSTDKNEGTRKRSTRHEKTHNSRHHSSKHRSKHRSKRNGKRTHSKHETKRLSIASHATSENNKAIIENETLVRRPGNITHTSKVTPLAERKPVSKAASFLRHFGIRK